MTELSNVMKLAIVFVAFIAGYAVVSYVVRKLKEGPFNPLNKTVDGSRTGSTSAGSRAADEQRQTHDEDPP